MDYDLLTDLIAAYRLHQEGLPVNSKTSLSAFAIWMKDQEYSKGKPLHSGHDEIIGRNEVEIEISKLIVYLNRYARLLIKKGLSDFPELVNEDFTYLYILMTAESMTKIQLIEKNVHEKPTGMEVIKRLLKHRLIGERDDENDKRSKRIFLTEKGKATVLRTLEQMGKVSRLISGTLSIDEKQQLFTLLKKLEHFHSPIFLTEKSISLNELHDRLDTH